MNMFLRRENIKRINIFQYFFTCTLKGQFQSSLYLVPRAPTARVGSGYKIKTDSTEFSRLDSTDSCSALEENEHVLIFMCTRA